MSCWYNLDSVLQAVCYQKDFLIYPQRKLEDNGLTVYLMEYFDVDFDKDDNTNWQETRHRLMDEFAEKARGKLTKILEQHIALPQDSFMQRMKYMSPRSSLY